MPSEALVAIRTANRQVTEFLAQYPSTSLEVNSPVPNLAPLSEVLGRAGKALQESQAARDLDSSAKAEIAEYVENLKRLKTTLESLQPQLEGRRDAIRDRLGKIKKAIEWANSFNQTHE